MTLLVVFGALMALATPSILQSAIAMPENAHAQIYAKQWECKHGYKEITGSPCAEFFLPESGYLNPSGESWSCLPGYMKIDDICQEIAMPENTFLADISTDKFGIAIAVTKERRVMPLS